jgi:Asp-tRNA(Asn)/Glu-tRNA(Gln) amidotransferase A subunit family amidase
MAVLGNGTDTGNSIRMPAATSAVIGVFPTRGLVSIAGIAPLDWLLDNTGPIARNVTDAAIALSVMAGINSDGSATPDPLDPRTAESKKAQPGPYTQYLKPDALKGKRFGVPAFILKGTDVPFQGIAAIVPEAAAEAEERRTATPLQPATRAAFMKSLDGLRAAGAEIVFDDSILPDSFAKVASRVGTLPYVREGTENFLKEFGPSQYHSPEEYEKAVGKPLPSTIIGSAVSSDRRGLPAQVQARIETDPQAGANVLIPRQKALAIFDDTLDRLHLDGYVYPATQMPPPDETMPQNGGISEGPHSETSWVNILGVPAVVVVGGWYPGGLPFGLEISTKRWHDGDLLGWAYAYEQATHYRHPPVLVESGLLPNAP